MQMCQDVDLASSDTGYRKVETPCQGNESSSSLLTYSA